jgi:hypothetical protein
MGKMAQKGRCISYKEINTEREEEPEWSWIWSNSTNTTIKYKEVYISV